MHPHPSRPICVSIPLVLLELRNLTVEFPSAQGPLSAVREISRALAPGQTLALVGESGSGKSVTALAIMGLLPPQARLSGAVLFEGRDLAAARPAGLQKMSQKKLQKMLQALRGARMAMIFQEPMTSLNPVMRVGDQIAETVLAHAPAAGSGALPDHASATGSVALPDPAPAAANPAARITRAQACQRAIEALREVSFPEPERRWRD